MPTTEHELTNPESTEIENSLNSPEFLTALLSGDLDLSELPIPFSEDIYLRGFTVAGARYTEHIDERFQALETGDRVEFFREPYNPHDEYAIVCRNPKGEKLGYVPMYENKILSRLMDAGYYIYGTIGNLGMDDGGFYKIFVKTYLKTDGGKPVQKPKDELRQPSQEILKGDSLDLLAAARHAMAEGYAEKAAVYFSECFEKISPENALQIARAYYDGTNGTKDFAEAVYWAEQVLHRWVSPQVLFLLSYIYEQGGYGVEKNRELAASYCQRAAKMGSQEARDKLREYFPEG